MPTITVFDGISINIYNGDHNPPHIHAHYNEFEIRLNINTLKPLKGGDMPSKQLRKVIEWLSIEENRIDALAIFKGLNPNLR